MITINEYTGNWQAACHPVSPKCGSTVRIHQSADDREYDDFNRCLKSNKLMIREYLRYHPRLQMNVYRIEKLKEVD